MKQRTERALGALVGASFEPQVSAQVAAIAKGKDVTWYALLVAGAIKMPAYAEGALLGIGSVGAARAKPLDGLGLGGLLGG